MLLLEQFHNLTLNPTNAARLKELVLQLAVRGKLTESWRKANPDVEPASELLKTIEMEKEQLAKEKKIKKEELLNSIDESHLPFELPEEWAWTRLGYLNEQIHYGFTASAKDSRTGIRLLRITDIQNNKVNWDTVPGCDITAKEAEKYLLNNGDILIARTGGTIGKSYQVNEISVEAVFASYLLRLIPSKLLNANYLKLFLECPFYWEQLYKKSMGTGQPNVNATSLKDLLVSLPPLTEQEAIVARVEELFKNIEALQEKTAQRIELKKQLGTAALQNLTTATLEDLPQNWQFLKENFGTLFSEAANVKKLRETILQLAVQGKLTQAWRHQNPNPEPASELLKRIQAEKAQLVKEKKIKKEQSLPPISENEVPYELPENWSWCRLGSVIELISGQHIDTSNYNELEIGFPYLTGPADFGLIHPVFSKWTEFPKVMANKNDILITVKGSGIGKLNILHQDDVVISRQLMAIRSPFFPKSFLFLFLKGQYHNLQGQKVGIAIPGIGREDILLMNFPFPPLAEQEAIVAKVDELMQLCDELEKQIEQSEQENESLMQAVVKEAFQIKHDIVEESIFI